MRKIWNFLICLVCLLTFTTSVDAASTTISAKRSGTKLEYIDGLEIYSNNAGSYKIYVLDNDTYFENSTTLRDPEEVNGGFNYILNNDNQTNSSNKDYYITQVAILWYEDYLNGNDNNISASLKEYIVSNSNDSVCYYINKLVNNAKKYGSTNDYIEIQNKNVTFSKSGSYYYSNDIEVITNDLSSTPEVKLYNAPKNASIYNNSLRKNGTGSFQVRIPATSFTNYNEDEFEIYVSAKTNNDMYYMYSNYGSDQVIYDRSYSGDTDKIEEGIIVNIDNVSNIKVRINVLDEDGDYIKNVKYNVYTGNCLNNTCGNSKLVHTFTTTNGYTTINNLLEEGIYTLERQTTNDNYDLNKKEIIEIKNTNDIQTFTVEETNDSYTNGYKKIKIYNPMNDSNNVIKVYNNNGSLIDSFRGNVSSYEVKLNEGSYYITDSSNTFKIEFEITSGQYLYVYEDGIRVKENSIDLEKYIDNKYYEDNNKYEDIYDDYHNSDNDYIYEEDDEENVYTSEDGTIHIDNLDGNSIDISQDVNTKTDVKIDWISNIIDCPITSLSSTIKYIIGAIILALGMFLTIKNVKKSKNNI